MAATASRSSLQDAIDASDIVGHWEWDIPNDRVHADAVVALLFNVDPVLAEAGASLQSFLDGMHAGDRARTSDLIAKCAEAGRSYVAEYRVHSADGQTRWILARGRFVLDGAGQPVRGSGLLIDITESKLDDVAYVSDTTLGSDHPLERAAEHCLTAWKAIHELPQSVLYNMSDMLLLEIGHQLSKLDHGQRSTSLH